VVVAEGPHGGSGNVMTVQAGRAGAQGGKKGGKALQGITVMGGKEFWPGNGDDLKVCVDGCAGCAWGE